MKKTKSPVFSVIKIVLLVLVILIAAVGLFFGVLTIAEYRPDDIETMSFANGSATKNLSVGDEVKVLTWNVGYCGLSQTADFFIALQYTILPGEKQCSGAHERPLRRGIDIPGGFCYNSFILWTISSAGTSVWFTPRMSGVRSSHRP